MTKRSTRMNDGDASADRALALEARFVVASFVIVLTAWAVLSLFHDPGTVAQSENRYRAPLPEWDAEEGGASFLSELDAHLADRVRFRDVLITLYSRVLVDLFGVSPSPKLLVGREGWFFFNDPVAVDQARGLLHFTPEELERWQRVLEGRRDWLAERGIPFVVVLVPNKHIVYPEVLPERFGVSAGAGTIDEQHRQLAAYLAARSDLVVVDLLPELVAAKERQRVYHKTDTHWNDVGAYAGYRAILAAVAQALPEHRAALEPVAVTAQRYEGRGIGLTSMVGLSAHYLEEVLQLSVAQPRSEILAPKKSRYEEFVRKQRPITHGVPRSRLPKAVVFRDSFSNALVPYLSENFSQIVYVWARDLEPRFVERVEPDIVIQQIAGRLLDREPIPVEAIPARSGSGSLVKERTSLTD